MGIKIYASRFCNLSIIKPPKEVMKLDTTAWQCEFFYLIMDILIINNESD